MPSNSTCYHIGGTDTFRLASRGISCGYGDYKIVKGTNLQNLEKSVRRIYKAKDGYKLNQVDQSGAEALIVAYLCKPGLFRDLFLNNIKPHVFVALHLFADKWKQKVKLLDGGLDTKPDIDECLRTEIKNLTKLPFWKDIDRLIKDSDNWSSRERYYYIAKQVCHSSNYGIKTGMFCLNTLEKSMGKIVISKDEGDKFLGIYHSLFPEIRDWHRRVVWQVQETRTLYSLQGYPKYISGHLDIENDYKKWYAAVPQMTVASITNIAFTKLQELIEQNKLEWDLLANTHDSYLTQSPSGENVECCRVMSELINQELTGPFGDIFKMKSEAQSGFNWSPYHITKNPLGLQTVKV